MTGIVVAVGRAAELHEAAQLLSEYKISGMPVVDNEKRVVGVISEADLLHFAKMKGGAQSPPGVGAVELFWSWLGGSIGIMICAYLSSRYLEPRDLTLLIGSFGASAVLAYGAVKSPLAQPRNLVGGHIISGLVGVACQQIFGSVSWFAAAMAVSFAIVAMLATKTLHPPGGATALIAVIGGTKIHNLGFFYALVPAGAGTVILMVVALIVNNLAKERKYPEYWV